MRLFTAIELSGEARTSIADEQRRIVDELGEGRSIRIVRSEHLHLTLVFIGEISADRVPAVIEIGMKDIPVRPFELVFGGIGAFPPRGRPRVLWLGVLAGAAGAIEVQRIMAARLAVVGVPSESRPYRPHLTLGRWRDEPRRRSRRAIAPAPREMRQRGGGDASRPIARVPVSEVTLFQSRLSPNGPAYTALARARLT